MECFKNIIGIVESCPDCTDGYKEEYSISKSGIYLDELKGIDMIRIDESVSDELWDICEKSMRSAAQSFLVDVSHELSKHITPLRPNYNGDIGKKQHSGNLNIGTFKGIKTYSDIRGGIMTINGFTLLLQGTETVLLKVYDSDMEVIKEYTLKSEAGKPKYNKIEPLTLPINEEYFFLYESVSNPLKNKFGCCGFDHCYKKENPCYSTKMGWSNWLMVMGAYGGLDSLKQNTYANGLSLNVSITCQGFNILCQDYKNDPVGLSIAFAIRYKAGEFLINAILDSNEVNRYQLLTHETAEAHIEYYNERYAALIEYIASEVNYFTNDCWRCKDRIVVRGQRL